jgi:hypothetical protein
MTVRLRGLGRLAGLAHLRPESVLPGHQPQSFSVPEVRLLIVLAPGFGPVVCLHSGGGRTAVPGVPGCAPAPTAPAVPPFVSLGLMVLVRRVLAGRRAAASR